MPEAKSQITIVLTHLENQRAIAIQLEDGSTEVYVKTWGAALTNNSFEALKIENPSSTYVATC